MNVQSVIWASLGANTGCGSQVQVDIWAACGSWVRGKLGRKDSVGARQGLWENQGDRTECPQSLGLTEDVSGRRSQHGKGQVW